MRFVAIVLTMTGDETVSDPLATWYVEAKAMYRLLAECCEIVNVVLESEDNLTEAVLGDIEAGLRTVDLWALGHPSPDAGEASTRMLAVVGAFQNLGAALHDCLVTGGSMMERGIDRRADRIVAMVEEAVLRRDHRILQSLRPERPE